LKDVFKQFGFEMCLAERRNSMHSFSINFQKRTEHVVFLQIALRHVFRATAAGAFSTSQLPRMLRSGRAFSILTSNCVSRRSRAHFFNMSAFGSVPTMVCFYLLLHPGLSFTYGVETLILYQSLKIPNLSHYKIMVLNLQRITENDNMILLQNEDWCLS